MHVCCVFLVVFIVVVGINGKHVFRERTTFSEDFSNATIKRTSKPNQERINMSYPGTKWCGPGNTAQNYNDLGEHRDVDKCCRGHDHCDNLAAGESRNNLTNTDYFTRLHCDCDKEFYECLHSLNSKASNRIGKIYFTLRNKCYRQDYPIVECSDYETTWFLRRCHRYVLDESKEKQYQWFDIPFYNGKGFKNNAAAIRSIEDIFPSSLELFESSYDENYLKK